MNNLTNSKSSKLCGNSTDLQKQIATPFIPSMSISTHLKDCKVVLEDISFACGAAKLQMLDLSQDKIHMTHSHHITESDFLKNLCLKTPIAWGSSTDEQWTQLDDKVSDKLHICATLAETVSLLQESIYTEAANIFGHLHIFNLKRERWLEKVDELSFQFNLFSKRTCFWLKLNQLLCQSNEQL